MGSDQRGPVATNLFADVPAATPAERVDVLVDQTRLRLERIVSTGHATPPGEWYDQDRAEWVVVLRGSAGLLFAGEGEARVMRAGDHVVIPAHRRHRVEWTDAHEPTVWLALHYEDVTSA
jgi:cupin 2 domain-containing protein